MSRSSPGQHRKVEEARRVVQSALGDAARRDQPKKASRYVSTKPPELEPRRSEAIGVLTIREAAARLRISSTEVERMATAGRVKTLMAGWTTVIPVSEVERLSRNT